MTKSIVYIKLPFIVTLFILLASGCCTSASDSVLPALHRNLASQFGQMPVHWNGRVCPAQTMARDVAMTLYGHDSYRGLTPDQILWGWITYAYDWEKDYIESHPELKTVPPYPMTGRQRQLADRFLLINRLTSERPFIIDVDTHLTSARIKTEILYNRWVHPFYAAVISLLLGMFILFFQVKATWPFSLICRLLFLYISFSWSLLWYLGNHIPLSNGPEIMMFLGMSALLVSTMSAFKVVRGASLVIAGLALSVAVMGRSVPLVTSLNPALESPLLSFHVMALMISYLLFFIIAVLSVLVLVQKPASAGEVHAETASSSLYKTTANAAVLSKLSRRLLVPAYVLLVVGVLIGSVWAKQSWGRYWGWDPKETCSMVMLIVYAVPLLCRNFDECLVFRREKPLAVYLLLAVLTVIFTYFGANYLLPGLHSYA